MKDMVHAAVHRSVHLIGEGKFYGALRLRFTRPLILDKGKTPEWAGATPLLHTVPWPKWIVGRSSPHVRCEARRGAKGDRDAASHPEELRASREVRILRPRDLRQMWNRPRCGSLHAERRVGGLVWPGMQRRWRSENNPQ